MTYGATRLCRRSGIIPAQMTDRARPISGRRRTPAARALALVTAVAIAATSVPVSPAYSQGRNAGIPMIRDAEIEQLMRDYSQPILRAAGLAQQKIDVVIINDRSFNAFV